MHTIGKGIRVTLTVMLGLLFISIAFAGGAFAAELALAGGEYTIKAGDSGKILEAQNGGDSYVLDGTTDIVVRNGDLTLTVNADVTIGAIDLYTGNLTISGDKTLTVDSTSSTHGGMGYSVFAYGDIKVSGKLDVVGKGVGANENIIVGGVLNNTGNNVWAKKNITVSGELSSNNSRNSGIASGSLTIDGGVVTANNNTDNGVWVGRGNITVKNGGTLTAEGNTKPGVAVACRYNLYIYGGTVTANNNKSNGVWMEGGDITLESGGTLTANCNTYPGVGGDSGYDLHINGGTVMANNNRDCGVWMIGGNIIMDGGSLTANGNAYNGAYLPNGNITINGGKLTANENKSPNVWVFGDIAITGGELTASNGKNTGVYSKNGNLSIDGGALTANGNASNGVYLPKGDIVIDKGGVLTVKGNGNPGIFAGNDNGEDDYAGCITVSHGELTSECETESAYAVYAVGDIVVGGKGKLTGTSRKNSGVLAMGNIMVSGTLTGEGSDYGVYAGDGITVSGTMTGEGSDYGVYAGNGITVSGTMTGDASGYGVYSDVGITITGGGAITGKGVRYGIYVKDNISVSGNKSTIKGIAQTRGNNDRATASVTSESGKIYAANGGVIWEDYTGEAVAFDDITPQDPYANGANIADIANYTWSPSLMVSSTDEGKGLLATANRGDVTVTGIRTGNAAGEPVKFGTFGTHKITFKGNLTAAPAPVPTLMVTPNETALEVDGTAQLTANESGVTWSSADEKVATVDAAGLVTAVGAGTVDITAAAPDGRTATCRVTVTKPEPVEVFDIGIEVLAVSKGKELILPVLKGYVGSWSVENESIAKLTKNGKHVKALKVGETTLSFKVDEVVSKKAAIVLEDRKLKAGESYTIKFNVRKAGQLPTGIALDAKKLTLDLSENKAARLTATVKPNKALDREVFWTSNKPGVATVDQDGNVTAVAPGTCKITAVSANLKRKTITVTVLGDVTKVTLSAKKKTLQVGDTFELTASVNEDALDKTITWTSGKPGVATVDEDGVVTALKKGKVKITATASNGKKAVCTVTVK